MFQTYLKVKDNYIVNVLAYDTPPSSNDGETYHILGSTTGSKYINSKYNPDTDSFIPPSQFNGIIVDYFLEEQEDGTFINYITGSTPATFSYNNNIASGSGHGIIFEGEVSDVWIENNNIGALLTPLTSSEKKVHTIGIDIGSISFIENEKKEPARQQMELIYTSSYIPFPPEF